MNEKITEALIKMWEKQNKEDEERHTKIMDILKKMQTSDVKGEPITFKRTVPNDI